MITFPTSVVCMTVSVAWHVGMMKGLSCGYKLRNLINWLKATLIFIKLQLGSFPSHWKRKWHVDFHSMETAWWRLHGDVCMVTSSNFMQSKFKVRQFSELVAPTWKKCFFPQGSLWRHIKKPVHARPYRSTKLHVIIFSFSTNCEKPYIKNRYRQKLFQRNFIQSSLCNFWVKKGNACHAILNRRIIIRNWSSIQNHVCLVDALINGFPYVRKSKKNVLHKIRNNRQGSFPGLWVTQVGFGLITNSKTFLLI